MGQPSIVTAVFELENDCLVMGASKDVDEDLVLALVTLVVSVFLVLVCIAAGWFVMWKLFLSR